MMDLNRATILGRLTRDPELRSLPTGKSVAVLGIATNRQWTDQNGQKQKQVEYHHVVLWSKLAEIAGQYLKKGARVYIEGRLQTREWAAQDGAKKNRTEIVGENLIMLDSARGGESSSGGAVATGQAPSAAPSEPTDEEIKVEDIPF
ncbi:MAG TPA: single-stranded DNA-binding protein [Patescibacteria group bacterium]|nr:single-stranded DNA-binding protein [Patescibacteria group bacterium]